MSPFRPRCALAALFLAAAPCCRAHDVKVLASQLTVAKVGGKTTIYLSWGDRLPIDDLIDADSIARYDLLTPAGEAAPLKKADLGLQTNVVETQDRRHPSGGGRAEGGDLQLRPRRRGQAPVKRGPKTAVKQGKIDYAIRSQQSGKALIVVGAAAKEPVKPAGLGFEIVPLDAPAAWQAGKGLRFRVLLNGKPLSGVDVKARYVGFKPDNGWCYATTSNRDGVLTIYPKQAGTWVLKANTKILAAGDAARAVRLRLAHHDAGAGGAAVRPIVSHLAALLLPLAAAAPALAHRLGADCTLRANKVEVEAFYDDDTPARQARVAVKDAAGKVVAEGRTDDKGRWRFSTPKAGRYRVTVDAGPGHIASVSLTVPAAPPSALTPLVARLKAVGAEGAGNVDAAAAYRSLVKSGPEAILPLLAALDDAGPAAGHWLRSAVDHIAEQAMESQKALPVQHLEAFTREKRHAPAPLPGLWLAGCADASASGRLLPDMLDDPALELRREAVAAVVRRSEKEASQGDRTTAVATLRRCCPPPATGIKPRRSSSPCRSRA